MNTSRMPRSTASMRRPSIRKLVVLYHTQRDVVPLNPLARVSRCALVDENSDGPSAAFCHQRATSSRATGGAAAAAQLQPGHQKAHLVALQQAGGRVGQLHERQPDALQLLVVQSGHERPRGLVVPHSMDLGID